MIAPCCSIKQNGNLMVNKWIYSRVDQCVDIHNQYTVKWSARNKTNSIIFDDFIWCSWEDSILEWQCHQQDEKKEGQLWNFWTLGKKYWKLTIALIILCCDQINKIKTTVDILCATCCQKIWVKQRTIKHYLAEITKLISR